MQRSLSGVLAAISFAICLASGVLIFLGHLDTESYRGMLAAASLAWFVFAAAWSGKAAKTSKAGAGGKDSRK